MKRYFPHPIRHRADALALVFRGVLATGSAPAPRPREGERRAPRPHPRPAPEPGAPHS